MISYLNNSDRRDKITVHYLTLYLIEVIKGIYIFSSRNCLNNNNHVILQLAGCGYGVQVIFLHLT